MSIVVQYTRNPRFTQTALEDARTEFEEIEKYWNRKFFQLKKKYSNLRELTDIWEEYMNLRQYVFDDAATNKKQESIHKLIAKERSFIEIFKRSAGTTPSISETIKMLKKMNDELKTQQIKEISSRIKSKNEQLAAIEFKYNFLHKNYRHLTDDVKQISLEVDKQVAEM